MRNPGNRLWLTCINLHKGMYATVTQLLENKLTPDLAGFGPSTPGVLKGTKLSG